MTQRQGAEADQADPRHPAVTGLVALVLLEAVLVAVGVVLVLIDSLRQGIGPMTIALLVTGALIALGLAWLGSGLVRRRRRLLGGVLTWQVLQLGCSVVGFQGILGPEWMGWVLFVPAVAGIVLCLSRPVTAVFGPPPTAH